MEPGDEAKNHTATVINGAMTMLKTFLRKPQKNDAVVLYIKKRQKLKISETNTKFCYHNDFLDGVTLYSQLHIIKLMEHQATFNHLQCLV